MLFTGEPSLRVFTYFEHAEPEKADYNMTPRYEKINLNIQTSCASQV